MERKIYGLQFDYVDSTGYYLMVNREGLSREELDPLAVNMFEATDNIPGVLPLKVEERDFNVRLHYYYGGKPSLQSLFKSHRLKAEEVNQILLSLLNIISNSKNYMLQEENYVLHEDFIFVGEDVGEIYLVYLPLQEIEGKKPLFEEIKELVTNLGDLSEDLTAHMAKFRKYLRSHERNFCIKEFKKFVIGMDEEEPRAMESAPQEESRGGDGTPPPPEPSPRPKQQPEPGQKPQPASSPAKKKKSKKEAEDDAPGASAGSASGGSPGRGAAKATPEKAAGAPEVKQAQQVKDAPAGQEAPAPQGRGLQGKHRTYVLFIAVLLLAGIWRLYLDYPENVFLYLSVGLTLIIVVVVLWLVFLWKPSGGTGGGKNKKEKNPSPQKGGAKQPGASGGGGKAEKKQDKSPPQQQAKSSGIPGTGGNNPGPASASDGGSSPSKAQNLYQTVSDKTTHLDAVVEEKPSLAGVTPCLEVSRKDGVEKIEIKGESFIIGRNPDTAGYVEADRGVSRAHLEIYREGEEWHARDLGTTNGSYLNEEKMIPNKGYSLKEGDVLRIARTEYNFKMG